MKGFSYSKATSKYFEKLFLEKGFVFLEKDKKNLDGNYFVKNQLI